MIACMENQLRPARRAGPTTDTRRQTHSGVGVGGHHPRQLVEEDAVGHRDHAPGKHPLQHHCDRSDRAVSTG
jgi:hypothetical protein